MAEITQDPKGYRPGPCPDCGGDQRVFGWACVDDDGRLGFKPARVGCAARCVDTTTSELATA